MPKMGILGLWQNPETHCPIGMLVVLSGYLPVLDYGLDSETKTDLPFVDDKEKSEPTDCNKRGSSCDIESIETMDGLCVKRIRVTEEFDLPQLDDTNVVSTSYGVKGRLLIGGFYQKLGDLEAHNIQTILCILVATKKT